MTFIVLIILGIDNLLTRLFNKKEVSGSWA